jgi:hypothetical protein
VADQRFGKRRRQRQEGPVPGARGKPRVEAVPHVPGGDDVEHGELLESAEMIERKPITDPAAAIMAGETKADKAERFHRFDHDGGHGALAIGSMIGVRFRHRGPAVAGQVGDHEGEMRRKLRRHTMPHHIALRVPVQQKQRRPAAADAGEDFADRRVDPARGVTGIEVGEVSHYFASSTSARAATPARYLS